MRRTPTRSRRRRAALAGAICAAALAHPAHAAGAAENAAGAGGPAPPATWRADLSDIDADDVNVRYVHGDLRLRSRSAGPASLQHPAGAPGEGTQVLAAERLDRPVNRVRADLGARAPAGAEVAVDVRGRAADGGWTEWLPAGAGTADAARLPFAVSEVQARLTLRAGGTDAAVPAVESLRLRADTDAAPRPAAAAAPLTYRLFATREGLVGGTTANGHVIVPNDHFVALPSRRGLSPKGSAEYSVQVCGPVRCETAPVWDVGPWNTKDDYWNPPSVRESWQDLPQGMPEAQAAYQNGYNGGLDEFGRRVANPAGIDLADGTFYNVGLNDNGWVDVTFLWTGEQDGKRFPTWGTDVRVRQESNTSSAVLTTLPGPTQVRVECQERGESVTYNGYTNDAWSYLPDYGGYISNIFVDVADAWLPGVPEC
ncbi:hypothetical protein [Streptomyces sp. MAR4 CNX-425]|uniref:hypothetical protein n=1 Tax=Streptomyces sp. MAR4 CNX-425 TaxID=3406343 RepID=UPI003B504132